MTAHTAASLARVVFDHSLLLLVGTLTAVAWANIDLASYEHIAHPLHFWVNDVGMTIVTTIVVLVLLGNIRQERVASGDAGGTE